MKQFNIPILTATLALLIGILSTSFFTISIVWVWIAILFLVIALVIFNWLAYKHQGASLLFGITLIVLFFFIGMLSVYRTDPVRLQTHYIHQSTEKPQTLLFSIEEVLKPSRYQNKYIVVLYQLDSLKSSGKLLLNINKDSIGKLPSVGKWYYARSTIVDVPTPKNPYQFDYGAYLKRNHIYGQIHIKHHELLLTSHTSKGIKVWASRFRESVLKKLNNYSFTKSQLAIMQALLLGQRQDINTEINAQYARAGMMHILAVSGLHVGIILLLLRLSTQLISGYTLRWVRSGIIIIAIWCFACITGASPSVLRAATMFSFLELGTALGGKRESHNAVIFSAFILLLIDPSLLYHIGFQLSYIAVIAILWIQPWLYRFYTPHNYILRTLWGTITVTIAAQLGVLPLSIFYFHQFPGLFLISNSVILPFLGILISVGVIILVLAMLDILPDILAMYYGKTIDTLNSFIAWVASQDAFIVSHISLSLSVMLSYYVVIIASISILQKYRFQKVIFLATVIITSSVILFYQKANPQKGHLAILHINKQSLIGMYTAHTLTLYSPDSLYDYKKDYRVKSYKDKLPIRNVEVQAMPNYFLFKQQQLLIIDSLGIYQIPKAQPVYILLSQSPNINLERMIDYYPTVTIIADGTNYKSDITRWKATCLKRKIPFHSTYEKGAFIIE